jgi:hypothetical protein
LLPYSYSLDRGCNQTLIDLCHDGRVTPVNAVCAPFGKKSGPEAYEIFDGQSDAVAMRTEAPIPFNSLFNTMSCTFRVLESITANEFRKMSAEEVVP